MQTIQQRFWSKVNKHGPRAGRLGRCWVWTAGRTNGSYGSFRVGSKMERAHRYAWGDVPSGLHVLHRCDNPPCVRRSHLFLGTQADNNRDMVAKRRDVNTRKTRCPMGHPYDAIEHGYRLCLTCRRVRLREWQRQRRAA